MITLFLLITAFFALSPSVSGLVLPLDEGVILNSTETWPTARYLIGRDDSDSLSFTDADADAQAESSTCDYTQTFNTLDDLNNYLAPPKVHNEISRLDRMSGDCSAYHSLKTLINMLDKAYSDYQSVDNGYDDLFKIYKDYMHDSTPNLITNGLMFTDKANPSGTPFHVDGPGIKCRYHNRAIDHMLTVDDRLRLHYS